MGYVAKSLIYQSPSGTPDVRWKRGTPEFKLTRQQNPGYHTAQDCGSGEQDLGQGSDSTAERAPTTSEWKSRVASTHSR